MLNRTNLNFSIKNISECKTQKDYKTIVLITAKVILAILNIFFNGSIIYIILFRLKRKTYSNFLFLSGTLSDFMIGLMSVPFMTIFTTFGFWPLGEATCIFWVINDFSIGTVSIYSLLLMSIHRFRQLKWPLVVNENMTRDKYFILIGKWILIYAFWGLSVVLITRQNFESRNCYFTYTFTYVLVADSVGYFLPVLSVFVMNTLVYWELRKKFIKKAEKLGTATKKSTIRVFTDISLQNQSQNITNSKSSDKKDEKSKFQAKQDRINKEKKAIMCIWSISIFLSVLFSVFCVTWPLKAFCNECVSDLILEIGYWMSYIYSSFNP
ncbi:histamine H3 receptor-like, partial [Brachionus plicatilis]